jgi:hypothetical protein
LIKQFLFPEAVLLQGDDLEAPRSASGGKPLEELVLQEAKCSTQKSRQAAFALLEELAHDYVPNFLVIKDLLLRWGSGMENRFVVPESSVLGEFLTSLRCCRLAVGI